MLGRYRLKDINPPLLSSLLSGITDLQPKSVKKIYVVIQSIFKRAVEQGCIRDCPCHNVILPKDKNKKKVHSLSVEEVKRLIKMLDEKPWDEDLKRIIKFLLFTGMRCGEALGLAWDDIDFENKMISISHTLNDIGGRHERTAPKTENFSSEPRRQALATARSSTFLQQTGISHIFQYLQKQFFVSCRIFYRPEKFCFSEFIPEKPFRIIIFLL